jgi:hypothetical protein
MVVSVVTVAGMLPVVIHLVMAVSVVIAYHLIVAGLSHLVPIHRSPITGIPALQSAHLVPGPHTPAVHADSQTVAVTAFTSLRGCEGWNNQGENQSEKKRRYRFHCLHLEMRLRRVIRTHYLCGTVCPMLPV